MLAPVMVVIGVLAAIDSARRGFTPPGGPPPLVFFVIPLADLAVWSRPESGFGGSGRITNG